MELPSLPRIAVRARSLRREETPPRPDSTHDELQILAETFARTVDRLAALMDEVDRAHRQALQAEVEKKQFYRQVLRAVTHGRFELVDRDEIPIPGPPLVAQPVADGPGYALARRAIRAVAAEAGMSDERTDELVIAAGEAISNAIKHAREGCCYVYRTPDAVIVRVEDHGGGIRSQDLPAAILTRGFSTKISLGMGYTMMLQLCDRIWLGTDCDGTTVQLEKRIHPAPAPDSLPDLLLDRMAEA